MRLIQALRKAKIARRFYWLGSYRHALTIFNNNFGYYTLTRDIKNTWEDASVPTERRLQQWNFRYLTDLFAFARQEGFFEEIAPNADDWIGDTEPKPEPVLSPTVSLFPDFLPASCSTVLVLSEEEEEELERLEQERLEEDAWASEHPGEVRVRNDYWDYGSWYDIPKYINDYSDEYGRRYSYLGDDV